MQLTGQVGPNGPVSSGAGTIPVRQGNLGDVIVTELNGRYYEQNVRGNVFTACNNAAQALVLVATAAQTGLFLANPTGSGKNFILLEAAWMVDLALTGFTVVGLSYGPYVAPGGSAFNGPTAATLGSGAASVAKIGSTLTFGSASTFLRPILGCYWVSTGANAANVGTKDEVAGALIIPPGQAIGFTALTTIATGVGLFTWAEVNAAVL